MTTEELYQKLLEVGIPVSYLDNAIEDLPQMPFITYKELYTNNFGADNHVHKKITSYQIDLYTKAKDFDLERQVEEVLSFTFWNNEDFPYENERCHRTCYRIKLI